MKLKYHSYASCEWISHLHFSHQLKNIAKKKKNNKTLSNELPLLFSCSQSLQSTDINYRQHTTSKAVTDTMEVYPEPGKCTFLSCTVFYIV